MIKTDIENKVAERYTGPIDISVTEKIGIGFGSIGASEMSQAEAEQEAKEIASFVTNIDRSSPAVCIDGRHLASGEDKLPLGAHIAGGAETLLVAAKSVDYYLQGKDLVDRAKELGYVLGGHDADSNKEDHYENGTGCGACDKCDVGCKLLNEHRQDVAPMIQQLMGPDFDKDLYDSLSLVAVEDGIRGIVDGSLIETLHDDHEGVHGHREQFVVFNYIEDTTIDRDAYFEQTGKQTFVVDLWYLKRLSNALATSVRADKQAAELYHAMVDFQVAAYLALCDGSHRAAILQ